MTFYEEVRAFFKKYDPARIRLAKKIAATYTTPKAQRAALQRLKEVYAAGGPDKFDFSAGKNKVERVAAKVETVVEEVSGQVENDLEELSDDADELPQVGE